MMLMHDDLVAVMPRAANAADRLTPALAAAMARYEIDTPARIAAFLAQLAHESGQLQRWSENLTYRWQRLREVFPRYFRTDADAQAFDRQPERIAIAEGRAVERARAPAKRSKRPKRRATPKVSRPGKAAKGRGKTAKRAPAPRKKTGKPAAKPKRRAAKVARRRRSS
jgi:hypothetical protein